MEKYLKNLKKKKINLNSENKINIIKNPTEENNNIKESNFLINNKIEYENNYYDFKILKRISTKNNIRALEQSASNIFYINSK